MKNDDLGPMKEARHRLMDRSAVAEAAMRELGITQDWIDEAIQSELQQRQAQLEQDLNTLIRVSGDSNHKDIKRGYRTFLWLSVDS